MELTSSRLPTSNKFELVSSNNQFGRMDGQIRVRMEPGPVIQFNSLKLVYYIFPYILEDTDYTAGSRLASHTYSSRVRTKEMDKIGKPQCWQEEQKGAACITLTFSFIALKIISTKYRYESSAGSRFVSSSNG